MTDLVIMKLLFIAVMGLSSVKLFRCAGSAVRFSGEWYAGWSLSVMLGIMAISEFAHLISLVRGM